MKEANKETTSEGIRILVLMSPNDLEPKPSGTRYKARSRDEATTSVEEERARYGGMRNECARLMKPARQLVPKYSNGQPASRQS